MLDTITPVHDLTQPKYDKSLVCCHAGGEYVELNDIAVRERPEVLGSRHNPVSFYDFVTTIISSLDKHGWTIEREAFVMKDGVQFFSVFGVKPVAVPLNKWMEYPADSDWEMLVGAIGSHDQTLPRRVMAGSRVFICDNLAFSGDLGVWTTKQTTNVTDRIPSLVDSAIAQLDLKYDELTNRYGYYQVEGATDGEANDCFVQAYHKNILTGRDLANSIDDWYREDKPEINRHNVWGVFNAMTAGIGKNLNNQLTLARRTTEAERHVDEYFGYA